MVYFEKSSMALSMKNKYYVSRVPYQNSLIDYYYDNIWSDSTIPYISFYTWLKDKYGADLKADKHNIIFDSMKHKTLFMLRWM